MALKVQMATMPFVSSISSNNDITHFFDHPFKSFYYSVLCIVVTKLLTPSPLDVTAFDVKMVSMLPFR